MSVIIGIHNMRMVGSIETLRTKHAHAGSIFQQIMSWIFEIFGFNDLKSWLRKTKMFQTMFKQIFNSYFLLERRDAALNCLNLCLGKESLSAPNGQKPNFLGIWPSQTRPRGVKYFWGLLLTLSAQVSGQCVFGTLRSPRCWNFVSDSSITTCSPPVAQAPT